MIQNKEKIVNLPNTISILRILIVPVLFYLAFTQQANGFIALFIFAELTDVLDGFLARKLQQTTQIGARLDSWGDFMIYATIAICAWILWPDILQNEWISFSIIVLSFTLPVIIGFIKFQQFTSYHTWSVKFAVLVSAIAYILLFLGLADWPFRLAALFCAYAAIEQIAITLLIHHEHVDIRSVWQIIRYLRRNK